MSEAVKKVIKVSEVEALLNAGLDRKGIKEKLQISHADMAKLFKHEKLKNRKPIKEAGFTLEDDTVEVATSEVAAAATETPAPTAAEEAQTGAAIAGAATSDKW